MTDAGLRGSELAEVRHQRHLERAERRATQLAERREEVLSREFMERAFLSKRGLKHLYAALNLEAGGHAGGVTPRQVRRAVEALFNGNGNTGRTKTETRRTPAES